jgi:hypothetical protein
MPFCAQSLVNTFIQIGERKLMLFSKADSLRVFASQQVGYCKARVLGE